MKAAFDQYKPGVLLWDISKQCKHRSDPQSSSGFWSGSTLYASEYSVKIWMKLKMCTVDTNAPAVANNGTFWTKHKMAYFQEQRAITLGAIGWYGLFSYLSMTTWC